MNQFLFSIEEITDPEEIARARDRDARHRLNSEWLQTHWSQLLPRARGRFVAVAGQEAFIAESPADAWDWGRVRHPADDGAIVRYVRPDEGPRIYADCR